jgi:sugar lactone lactonase YvrE
VYLTSEAEVGTWSARVADDGSLGDVRPFADQGGEGLAVDPSGNVYVAAGDVFVYDPAGTPIGRIAVPERPTSLAFGDADRRTLYITARHGLYAVRTRATAGSH